MEEAKLKKTLAMVCIFCMLVALTACSGSQPTATDAPVYEETVPEDFAIPLGDTGMLENNPEPPPSSRLEGLRLLYGLETSLSTSLQTPQEA